MTDHTCTGRIRGASKIIFIALMLCALATAGCASKYGKQTTKVAHYPDCYAPIQELRKTEFAVEKSTAAGAVIGGVVGAITGLIASGGKASGAIVGGAIGAAGGGAIGYGLGKSNQDSSDSARLAEYNSRLDSGIRETNKATAAAKLARQCYERQFTVAVSEYKSKHINKEQFRQRYTEVLSGLEEAANILGQANKNSSQVVTAYNKAIEKESEGRGVPSTTVRTAARQKKTPSNLNNEEGRQLTRMAEKTNTMEKSVAASQQEERLLRERLASTRKQAEDLMS